MEEINIERAKAIITIVVTSCVTIANMYGWAVDADEWVSCCLCILNGICLLYTWWKNQNITEEALKGQHLIDRLKSERKAA